MTDAQKPARTPRKWIAAIGGWSPDTGVISRNPRAYDRFPESTERVWVQEVMTDETAPADVAPAVAADWLPTAENVNALPEPIRRHIHDLATRCDPAGEVVTNAMLRDHIRMVEADNERLRAAPAPAVSEPGQAVDVAAAIEEAFTDLARELGCFHSTDIPSNAGLFVPGQPKAQPNARAALAALFAHVREGGLVHRPLTADTLKALGLVKAPTPAAAPELVRTTKEAAPAQAEPAAEQIGLF